MAARPIIGVAVLIWRDKKLLLGCRTSPDTEDCWQFPGGHLEAGETVIQCAQREALEETGLKVGALRHIGYTDNMFKLSGKNYITLFVSGVSDSGDAVVTEADKCRRWQWFDPHRLPTPLFQPITLFVQQQAGCITPDDASGLYALHRAAEVVQATPSAGRR